jgi:FkbM family methyltransferase
MKARLDLLRAVLRSDALAAMFLVAYTRGKSLARPDRVALGIRKVGQKRWRVSDGVTSIDIYTPYRALNYSKGIAWRLHQLAESYGYGRYYEISQNGVVIDVGANVGEFTIHAARQGARVFAFEPDPNVFDLLQINVSQLGSIFQPYCFPCAVSNSTGAQSFYLKSLEADSTLVAPARPEQFSVTQVKTLRLDDFIESQGIEVVDLVKCDAEGAEPEVVASAERALARIKMFVLDCSPERNGIATWPEVTAYLEKHNFEVLSNPLSSSRGLVAARNKAF